MYPGVEAVLIATVVSTVTDVRRRKIPNWITGPLAIVALGLSALVGFEPFATSLGILVGFTLVGFVAFSFGWLGGGDVKLLAASAAALHFHDILLFLIATSIGGGVFGLIVAGLKGRLISSLRSVFLVLRPAIYKGTASVPPDRPIKLPYAVAIAVGAVVVSLSVTVAPSLRLPF